MNEGEPAVVDLSLTSSQEQLWFLRQLYPNLVAYNSVDLLELSGPLDPSALTRAVHALTARHPVLRATFHSAAGVPFQRVSEAVRADVSVIDAGPGEPIEALARACAMHEVSRPFDLATGPLMRTRIFTDGAETHYLVLVFDHSVVDDSSLRVLFADLENLYMEFRTGRCAPPPAMSVRDYADIVVAHRAEGEALADATQDRWRVLFGSGAGAVDLPADRPRPRMPSFGGAWVPVSVDAATGRRLRVFALDEGATPFAVLLAAYAATLSRYGDGRSVAIASPFANRDTEDQAAIVAFLANTVPLLIATDHGSSFRDFVKRSRDAVLDGLEHQAVPFDRIVRAAAPQRDPGSVPLVQAQFVQEDIGALELDGVTCRVLDVKAHGAKFDLTLLVRATPGGGWSGYLEYATDRFAETTASRLRDQWLLALGEGLRRPDEPVASLPLLTPGERRTALRRAPAPGDYGEYVLAQIATVRARQGDEAALIVEGRTVGYAELWDEAERVAGALQTLGLTAGDTVAVGSTRDIGTYSVMLGLLMAGAVFAPFELSDPIARVAFTIADSRARLVIVPRDYEPGLPIPDGVLRVAHDELTAAPGTPRREHHAARSNDEAYIIYTSGSTGTPKGVVMSRGALDNHVRWAVSELLPHSSARTLQFSPLNFDISLQEAYSAWCNGETLVVPSVETRRDPDALAELIDEQRVSRLFVTPLILDALANRWLETAPPRALRDVYTSGDQLRITPAIRTLFEATGARLQNQYGATEAHVVTAYVLDGPPRDWPELPPIGHAIADQAVYILDAYLAPVPTGARGEICFAGPQLALEYRGRPELTRERFVHVELPTVGRCQIYRTGDYGRWGKDGEIDILGRQDRQVKIQGYRVELGDVETSLLSLPGVDDAVVAVEGGTSASRALVAYVVATIHTRAADVRSRLAETLPRYMIPRVVVLEVLPRTANGKVDVSWLQATATPWGAGRARLSGVATETERLVVDAWTSVLGSPPETMSDDFFSVGGHSLAAARLAAELRQSGGREVRVRDVFDGPTPASLAATLDALPLLAADALPGATPSDALPPTPPVSPNQVARLLRREAALAAGRQPPVGNVVLAYWVDGPVDSSRLRSALAEVIERHEGLRACFAIGRQTVSQEVRPAPATVELAERRFDAGAEHDAERWSQARIAAPFAPADDIRLRASVACVTGGRCLIAVAVDHLVADGWSLGVIDEELRSAYGGAAGLADPRGPESLTYRQALTDADAWLHSDEAERTFEELRALGGASLPYPPAPFPPDRPGRPLSDIAAAAFVRTVCPGASEQLRRFAAGAGLSPFIVFIGALTHAVRGVNHEPRLGFMTIFANREAAGAHDTVAYLANRMPLFVDGGADGLMSALIAARLGVLRALAMQRFPFMEVVRRLAPDLFGRSPRRPTMMVNFLDPLTAQMRRPEQVGGTAWTWVDLEPVSPSLGLNLFIDPGDPALSIETRFDPAAYTGERVRALVDDVIAALLDMISDELGSIVASSDRRPQPNQHPPSS